MWHMLGTFPRDLFRPLYFPMAGHSQFKNIMYRKRAQDAKRARAFTKADSRIDVASSGIPDPAANPAAA